MEKEFECFEGKLYTIFIDSKTKNKSLDDDVEQKLKIYDDGIVEFRRFRFNENKTRLVERKTFFNF